jgi:hypothetical protein
VKFPYDEAIQLAKVTRPFLPRGRSLLYHGSRSPAQILRENVLLSSEVGTQAVSFSRLPHVAIYWATMKRENEQFGAVFVLDRDLLAQTYKLEPFRDPIWDDHPELRARKSSEAEEHVWRQDVVGLNRFLVDVIWFSPDGSLHATAERRAEPLSACYGHRSPANLSTESQARSSGRQTMKRLVLDLRARRRGLAKRMKKLEQRNLVEAEARRISS